MGTYLSPADVAAALNGAGVTFRLIGAHAAALRMDEDKRPALDEDDVDVVVLPEHLDRAAAAITDAFGDLRKEPEGGSIRFQRDGKDVIDFVPFAPPLYDAGGIFAHSSPVVLRADVECEVPVREMVAAMKVRLMAKPQRSDVDRQRDLDHFIRIMASAGVFDTGMFVRLIQRLAPSSAG